MLIRTVCPRCQTSFQVQPELRGKAMRCPVPTCQKVFPIIETFGPAPAASPPGSGSAPPARPNSASGGVGDVVPLLPGELTSAAPPSGGTTRGAESAASLVPLLPAEAAGPSWREGAPPVRSGSGGSQMAAPPPAITSRPTRTTEPPSKPARSGPIVKEAGEWAAPPPVRRGGNSPADPAVEQPVTSVTDAPAHAAPKPPPHARLAKWIIIPFALLTVIGLAAGGLYVYWIYYEREAYLAGRADETYDNGTFRTAANDYAQLAQLYPESEKLAYYQFRAELAKLRHAAKEPDDDLPKLLAQFTAFLEAKEKDPLLKEHAADVGTSLVQVTTAYAEEAAKDPKDRAPLDVIDKAQAVLDKAQAIKGKGGKEAPDWAKVKVAFGKLREAVALAEERLGVLASLDKLAATGTYAALLAIEELLATKADRFPNLGADPEVKSRLLNAYKKHRASVKYTEATGDKVAVPPVETEPALVFDPLVGGTAGTPRRGTPVALALARGVLYGLDRDTGRVRWAQRVGIDTTALPARVSAGDGNRERILALSSDTRTLTALDSDGSEQWRYAMKHPCLGRPVVVENRAYLATVNGDVHEIELIEGKLLGTYSLGQRLTLGGTHEPSSTRVYFPADDGCVYVLNVRERVCESILYSRHPAGSLRGEVILLGPEEDAPGYLLLPQASGLDSVELRVFKLPIENKFEEPLTLAAQHPVTPPARLDGWTWFRPHYDSEKLAMLSDTGMLGLFGIRQPRNRDQALFPLLPGGGTRVATLVGSLLDDEAEQRGRAEVVQMQGDDVWVLAANRLQRLKLAWDRDTGPRLIAAWPTTSRSREVGSPLHAAQSFEDDTGKNNLVVVTQPPRRPAVWASCIDDESGDLRWRRQLGVVCEGEPLALKAKGQEPMLMVLDQSGSMFSIDPSRYKVSDNTQWISDEKLMRLGDSLDENPAQPPLVLRIDESSLYVIACPGEGKELVVRHVQADPNARRLTVKESKVALPDRLAGTPAVVGSRLILPLANDRLARLPLPINERAPDLQGGPTWKSPRAEPEARCHVVALGGDRFLTTDGLGQLRVWDWPADKRGWEAVPKSRGNKPNLDLSDRVVSAPLLLPGGEGQLVVADSAGMVRLLELQDDGALSDKRAWAMRGPVLAGPYVETVDGAVRIGCVGRGKLLWIDPENKQKPWEYKTNGAKIVGLPRVAAGMVVVADQEGRYVGLDPKTGEEVGAGHRLKGSIAAASGVAAFGEDRLMAPLSDGTLLLLGVKRLKGK